jgi:hypothetical protein
MHKSSSPSHWRHNILMATSNTTATSIPLIFSNTSTEINISHAQMAYLHIDITTPPNPNTNHNCNHPPAPHPTPWSSSVLNGEEDQQFGGDKWILSICFALIFYLTRNRKISNIMNHDVSRHHPQHHPHNHQPTIRHSNIHPWQGDAITVITRWEMVSIILICIVMNTHLQFFDSAISVLKLSKLLNKTNRTNYPFGPKT